MVRIGILSAAHMHAASYAACVNKLQNASLVGLFDDDREQGQKAADSFGCALFADTQPLLQGVDAVIICSENSRHKELTLLAAEAKCHVLCEKPIATTLEDGQAMIHACQRAGVQLQIAFPCRFSTPVRRAKELLDAGAIGNVLAVTGTNHGQMPGGWFVDRDLSGGGAVLDHTVHVVDLVRWFLGREFSKVYAEVDSRLYDMNIDDCGMLAMELDDGTVVTQDPSWSRPAAFPMWGDVTLELTGTKGRLVVDAFAQHITVYDDDDRTVRADSWADDMDFGLICDFVEMVETGRAASITGWDGQQALAVALAAYESSEKGEAIRLQT